MMTIWNDWGGKYQRENRELHTKIYRRYICVFGNNHYFGYYLQAKLLCRKLPIRGYSFVIWGLFNQASAKKGGVSYAISQYGIEYKK